MWRRSFTVQTWTARPSDDQSDCTRSIWPQTKFSTSCKHTYRKLYQSKKYCIETVEGTVKNNPWSGQFFFFFEITVIRSGCSRIKKRWFLFFDPIGGWSDSSCGPINQRARAFQQQKRQMKHGKELMQASTTSEQIKIQRSIFEIALFFISQQAHGGGGAEILYSSSWAF